MTTETTDALITAIEAAGYDFYTFLDSYKTTALWSSLDNDAIEGLVDREGENLDDNYSNDDMDDDLKATMKMDCAQFITDNLADLLEARDGDSRRGNEGNAGHDFWLTRHHHGAGFWDGDYEKGIGDRLTTASQKFREMNLWGDDDGVHAD